MSEFLTIVTYISLGLLALAACMVLVRLLIGPSLPDRVVAIDVMSVLVICVIAIFIIISRKTIYLDIIIAIALISFLGTIAFAQFIEWQLSSSKDTPDD